MSANESLPWGVIIADVVGSSAISALRQIRDQTLGELSEKHLRKGRVLAEYTVTAWDEFQNVLATPWEVPQIIWDLRIAFFPIELRIGVGLGSIEELPSRGDPINEVSSGEAFRRAREAISSLDGEPRKYPLRTALRSGDPALDRIAHLVDLLTDSLLSTLSNRQQETIRAYDETGRLEKAAAQLRVASESTVSRNLQRGFYWQLRDARTLWREILRNSLASGSAS